MIDSILEAAKKLQPGESMEIPGLILNFRVDPEDIHNEWVHPFECNELHTKLIIFDEFPLNESMHIEVCKQIGGGC